MHPDKTKIPTNISRQHGRTTTHADIDGDKIEILSTEQSTKCLGRKLSLHGYHCTELTNRIGMGWRKFNQLRDELTSKR